MNTINGITFMNDIGIVCFYLYNDKYKTSTNRSKLGLYHIFLISLVSFACVFNIHNVTFVFHDKWEI